MLNRDIIAAFLLAYDDADMTTGPSTNEIRLAREKIIDWKTEKHSGDCTDECHSCVRCAVDRFYNSADTLAHLLEEAAQRS